MARWGLVIVAIYGLVALLTPVLLAAGLLPDPNAGLENPIYAPSAVRFAPLALNPCIDSSLHSSNPSRGAPHRFMLHLSR